MDNAAIIIECIEKVLTKDRINQILAKKPQTVPPASYSKASAHLLQLAEETGSSIPKLIEFALLMLKLTGYDFLSPLNPDVSYADWSAAFDTYTSQNSNLQAYLNQYTGG